MRRTWFVILAAFAIGSGGDAGAFSRENLPEWMRDRTEDHLFYRAAPYNFSVYSTPQLALDLNAVAVGHAMAYEDLVTGREAALETETFERIDRVLRNPPRFMPDEATIGPTFARRFGALEKLFDWAHVLHAQTIDVLADPNMSNEAKDSEIERLWRFYLDSAPYTITGLPMNMDFLWSQPESQAFRRKYPRVNGLFWGYHWLQTSMYDMLWRTSVDSHVPQYELVGSRYHELELYKTDREFMPMMGETSPRFASRFPEIANAFDNLHMLHDMVNDVLASPEFDPDEQDRRIEESMWGVLTSTHIDCSAGEGEPATLHDHRFPAGMPGMGMMKGSDEDVMYMSGMGWMNMSECAHCSIRLPKGSPWGATLSMEGWTMTVRCLLCARDMATETPGRGIIRAATEDPDRTLVLIGDEEGNWTASIPEVVFLETEGGDHPECSDWSRAFTSRAAFDSYLGRNPEFAGVAPLDLIAWSVRGRPTPETYQKIDRPNPYREEGGEE